MKENDRRIQAYMAAAKRSVPDDSKKETQKKSSLPPTDEPHLIKTTETEKNPNPSRPLGEFMDRYGMLKVTKPDSKQNEKDNIYRRVAKFLLLIGVDEAAKIIPHLTPEQTEKIIPEIASIRSVDSDEASVILAEFSNLVEQSRHTGGVDTAKDILEKAFGPERATQMIEKTVAFPDGKPFEYMADLDSERIMAVLKDESGPIRALVLSYLKPAVAAGIINQLSPDEKSEVIRRLAKLEKMPPDIIRRIDHAMHEKIQSINTEKANVIDGRGALAGILKKMTPDAEKSILQTLSDSDPDLSKDIKNRLFTMDDVLNADDRFLQTKLQSMTDKDIAYLIAGKEESFRGKILSNVSSGRGNLILQEEKIHKPMLRRDCDEITNAFFSYLRRSWESGELIILNRDDEIYV